LQVVISAVSIAISITIISEIFDMTEKHSEYHGRVSNTESNIESIESDGQVRTSSPNRVFVTDVESLQGSPVPKEVATVFKFRPTSEIPKIRLLSSQTSIGLHVTLKAVIRRKAIVIVTERRGDWWNCTSSGYQGWANITPVMLEKRVLVQIESLQRHEDWRGQLSATIFVCLLPNCAIFYEQNTDKKNANRNITAPNYRK
jgi:hypothetical protein